MKNRYLIVGLGISMLVVACATNPFTGKNTLALVSNSEILPSAFAQYSQFLSENKVISGTTDAKRVENVGSLSARFVAV